MAIKLIVGLGNPDSNYKSNRHNYGFMLLDYLATSLDANFKNEKKFFAKLSKTNIAGNNIYLLKPSTYMNNSGRAVVAIANFYNISKEQILIVHDELDLPIGMAKIKLSGGHGRHNGLRDIISCLSSKDFYRLRLGIGRPDYGNTVDFVLGNFSKEQQKIANDVIANVCSLIIDITSNNIDRAMQILHTEG